MTVRPLIEQWFPAPIIGAESLRERGSTKAYPPINFLHVWWARRPLLASRGAVVASLLPAWPSDDEAAGNEEAARALKQLATEFPGGQEEYRAWFLEALGILGDPVAGRRAIHAANEVGSKLEGNGYGYGRAFMLSPDDATIQRIHRLAAVRAAGVAGAPSVLDPFAGGGSIPFEAARFGCATVANELNPVAAAILQGTVALPARFGPEFASTLRVWGDRWAERVSRGLEPYFPKQAEERSIAAYIWAHTVPCPGTGRPTPLAPDYWLARGKAGRDEAVRLDVDPVRGEVQREIIRGPEAASFGTRSTYKQGAATSIWTNETFGGDYIREQATAGTMGEMLLAVAVARPGKGGRQFRAPSAEDLAAVESARAEVERRLPQWEVDDLVPNEEIPYGTDTRPQQHGMYAWRQMFTPRQLLVAATALDELRKIVAEARAELDADGARALNMYLAFALDKALDYNGQLSSWDATRTKVRNTFDRHDFSFKWSFAEFDGTVVIPWAVDNAVINHEKIAKLVHRPATLSAAAHAAEATIHLGSATELPLADQSVDAVITDPPYYDNVMYAECSDYFYVWLKRSLRDTWPELCTLSLTDKEAEAVANKSLFRDVAPVTRGRKKPGVKSADDLADEHYETLLTRAFREAHRVLKDDGVLTVMFTHKRVDAWDTLGQALLEAGFAIHSSWPVHTESGHSLHQAKKNAASSTIFLTCRKRGTTEPAWWADLRGEVGRVAREAVGRFSADGLTGIDLTLSTFGPVLSVLSRNWPVHTGELDAEGRPQVLRPDVALDLARAEVARLKKRGLLGGRDVEFDRITDWYLLAWSDFGAAEFPSGEALKLSIATHLDLDELVKEHKVIRATSGTVTLLTPTQRRTAKALDPGAMSWPTLLDGLHSLMLVYEEDGLAAARAWLERTGNLSDPRFADLVAAALHAVPRARDKGELVRPEARTLEGLRATLFEAIPAPVEPEAAVVPAVQGTMDDLLD